MKRLAAVSPTLFLLGICLTSCATKCHTYHAQSKIQFRTTSRYADYDMTLGNRHVFRMFCYRGRPSPKHVTAECLYLEMEPSLVAPEVTLRVPSEKARAAVWRIRKDKIFLSDLCEGTIAVRELSGDSITLEIDLRVETFYLDTDLLKKKKFYLPWEKRGEFVFLPVEKAGPDCG